MIKPFKEFISPKIKAKKEYTVYRDGGSHGHEIINSNECGFCRLIQDFSIGSKERGTRERWYLNPNPPNHTHKIETDLYDIEWV